MVLSLILTTVEELILYQCFQLCSFESINFKKKYRKWRFGYNSATVVEIKDPAKSIFWWNWTLVVGVKWKIPIQWLSVLAIMIISWFPIENYIYLLYLYRDFKNCFSFFIKISLCWCHQDTDTDDNCLLWMKNLFTNHE